MRAKHAILKKYLHPWIQVLLSFNTRVICVDGFAGKGRFDTGEDGSPLLMLNTALKYLENKSDKELMAYFIEIDENNYEELNIELSKLQLPSNIKYSSLRTSFEDFLEKMQKVFFSGKKKNYPCFFFIDPFSYHIRLVDLKFISKLSKSEFLLTFMYRDLNRFIEASHTKDIIPDVLGMSQIDIKNILSNCKTPKLRERTIINLYKQKLQSYVGFRHLNFFRVPVKDENRTLYYLVHATNHSKGLRIMKDIMVGLGGRDLTYKKKKGIQLLDRFLSLHVTEITQILLSEYESKPVFFFDIMEFISTNHSFLEKEVRETLHKLEDSQKIKIKRFESKSTGISDGDMIIFVKK